MTDIELVEIDVEGVGQPLNDGTPGSALYRVPIRLNQEPSRLWNEVAVRVWDNPPSCTTMHRQGIASVEGDRFVLDGTTIEEVEQHHAETLRLVVARANQEVRKLEEEAEIVRARETREQQDHQANVAETAKKITFD